ncbi:hypothetical protein CEUSTIGMA_g10816.t1 [Chlamydomonas eustigma]|uniref:DNA-directed RNA polymerase III subunit n=1 Tax=Chlamydomonas eustigma TaxID=1157962 RepID=A0A250XJX6_9CHLO|nr:hypothetical protein CEUSTIGMA_g10816.t1 [Chlamydomonas eustigma]|eukprot:GAX83391.1 hypothetical protein CEUSTIGMA_g10816.t1 [Chlamydomonas eustigma]
MASRGRGRGRGGGFGRPGAPGGPAIRDEDGTVIPNQQLGPPPLYPEMELPEYQPESAKDALLLLRRHDLVNYSKNSPFFLDTSSSKKRSRQDTRAHPLQPDDGKTLAVEPLQLAAVLTLNSDYFPEELYGPGDKRLMKLKAREAFWKAQGKKDDTGGINRLEQLAKLESKSETRGGASGSGAAGDDAALQDEIPVDTDDEEDQEFDDYYQGEHFDDDEGYDDGGDDGGDDGAIY